ncbi:hypothetical protein GF359_02785 [candidate division WOR-3 bacterium]|uniref:Uncharacterized protein n=1 Tax=candidate division WOR-3 bacterium TaxID=2052148 RepID=A0A9D5K8M2_UNCW3|nr:hypothetical protein [candidate division WOR-3 bacterium]MBD3364119.1 hypothetical protein [candidate division WOR-3 bacterium]
MRRTTSSVGLVKVFRMVLVMAIITLSFLSIGCPIMLARVNTGQKGRMDSIEDDLYRLTKNYVLFLDDYNMHLYNEHGIDPVQESRYYVDCVTRGILKKARISVTPGHRFKQLEAWGQTLFSCSVTFQDTYLAHVRSFHEALPLDIDIDYSEPLSPREFEVRLQTLESNVIRFSEYFHKLEKMYNTHAEEFHGR